MSESASHQSSQETVIAGETVTIHAERAIFWQRSSTLIIADPHFGKASTFRAAGIPIPGGISSHDLSRLHNLLVETKAERLVILGDFFHTRASQHHRTLSSLATWRAHHQNLCVLLVRGNHDRYSGPPPDTLGIESVDEPAEIGPFVLRHHPTEPDKEASHPPDLTTNSTESYVLAGHLHPAIRMRDRDGTSLKLPCFWFGKLQGILPAFGTFTGGATIRPVRSDKVFAIIDASLSGEHYSEIIPIHPPS